MRVSMVSMADEDAVGPMERRDRQLERRVTRRRVARSSSWWWSSSCRAPPTRRRSRSHDDGGSRLATLSVVDFYLMAKGNLRDFLRACRPDADEGGPKYPLPPASQYFTWAAQIADGMGYLESLKFCHRDLAARNCLIDEAETVKIGDFGMARDVYYHEYYAPVGKRLMPIRWVAPEALKDGRFTIKSDVWSYAVVIYEMLTLGQQPYAGLANEQVFNYVCVQRRVMTPPLDCPAVWYALMSCCWRFDPRDRPTFAQIVLHLQQFQLDAAFGAASFVLNGDLADASSPPPYEFDLATPHEHPDGEFEDSEASPPSTPMSAGDVCMLTSLIDHSDAHHRNMTVLDGAVAEDNFSMDSQFASDTCSCASSSDALHVAEDDDDGYAPSQQQWRRRRRHDRHRRLTNNMQRFYSATTLRPADLGVSPLCKLPTSPSYTHCCAHETDG